MTADNTQKIDTSGIQSIVSLTDNGHACVREGYPILLLRKSAIHRTWVSSLVIDPPPTLEGREPAEPLQDHHNVLRVLREGYVYILAGTEAKKDYVSCYEVLDCGVLREKSLEDFEVDGKAKFPTRCLADNHYVPASFISVDISADTLKEKPFLWIAYSRYAWNKTTRDYYKKDGDLARFSKVDLASLIQSPANHPRGVSLTHKIGAKSPFDNILEFLPYVSSKVQYLPNYKDWSKQTSNFTDFIQQRESKYKKPVGAIVLEDILGMAEELNFQRLAEVNYTGDITLHNKTVPNKSDLPYEYNELHTPQGQYKKLNYDLIEQYKVGTKQHFDHNSKDGTVFVSSIENLRNFFMNDKWQYGGKGEVIDQTGNILYTLSQSEKSRYDFDQYWAKLNAQLNMDEYERFANVVKRYEQIKKNNGRDYTLYCRWLFCDKLPASEFFSGREHELKNNQKITFPLQTISAYNTVNFWLREYNYHNQDIHNDILGDAIAIFRTMGTSYYDMGLWDELLSSDSTYFHQVIAGNSPLFWKEGDIKSLVDKADEAYAAYNSLVSECISNGVITLANAQNIIPEVADKHLENITNASGVQDNLASAGHSNAKTRTITFKINTNKVNSLTNNKSVSINSQAEIPKTKQTSVTLTLFCDDDGFKNIESYVKRTNQGNRAANDVNKLATVIDSNVSVKAGAGVHNANLVMQEFNITLPEDRFKQLDARLKKTHGTSFSGFEQVTSKDGLVTATFKGRGTAEGVAEVKAYLQKYASNNHQNRFATVKTLLTKITNNHIDVTIHSNSLSEASQQMSNVIRESTPSPSVTDSVDHSNSISIKNTGQAKPKGAHAATSKSILFELFLLAWQAKLLRDNTNQLDKLNLKQEVRDELFYGILFASVSITINAIKTFTVSVKHLADMAGDVKLKIMVNVTNKAAALSEKVVMRTLIGAIGRLEGIARFWGFLEGIKDTVFGGMRIASGLNTSGWWQVASGTLLAISALLPSSGPGIVLSIICVVLSIFCMFMSESTLLTPMEQWFDRGYFGKNELNGNLSRYSLTEEGVKKLAHGFYGASRGYTLFLTKKSQSSLLGFDTGSKYDIYLNLILPHYQPATIHYYGSLISEKFNDTKKTLIGHNLTQDSVVTTTLRDDTNGGLSPLEMKVDFSIQNTDAISKPLITSNQTDAYQFDEQGSLVVCQPLYMADDKMDKKVSILGYITEYHNSDNSFMIELEDYIDI